jgi:ribosome recycling factor
MAQVQRMQEERRLEVAKRMEEVEKRNKLANSQFRRDEAELQRELNKGSLLKESKLQQQKKATSPYAKMFQDKETVKKAFIMSEIFNRKY